MTNLTFEYLKGLIDEHFDGMTNEVFEKNLIETDYEFYSNIHVSLLNRYKGQTRNSSSSSAFDDIVFEAFDFKHSCFDCAEYAKAA
ncbi:hypothetical protein [Desulfovibrio sp. JC010]|uniref:hypothetical protein n=1 Tax=Desulfovibrio sp. JC010 TaxID=2593641 RepID=UPI0013CFC99E|nr:hypothetical protein [Desulfovibrio sp. JC010]